MFSVLIFGAINTRGDAHSYNLVLSELNSHFLWKSAKWWPHFLVDFKTDVPQYCPHPNQHSFSQQSSSAISVWALSDRTTQHVTQTWCPWPPSVRLQSVEAVNNILGKPRLHPLWLQWSDQIGGVKTQFELHQENKKEKKSVTGRGPFGTHDEMIEYQLAWTVINSLGGNQWWSGGLPTIKEGQKCCNKSTFS